MFSLLRAYVAEEKSSAGYFPVYPGSQGSLSRGFRATGLAIVSPPRERREQRESSTKRGDRDATAIRNPLERRRGQENASPRSADKKKPLEYSRALSETQRERERQREGKRRRETRSTGFRGSEQREQRAREDRNLDVDKEKESERDEIETKRERIMERGARDRERTNASKTGISGKSSDTVG